MVSGVEVQINLVLHRLSTAAVSPSSFLSFASQLKERANGTAKAKKIPKNLSSCTSLSGTFQSLISSPSMVQTNTTKRFLPTLPSLSISASPIYRDDPSSCKHSHKGLLNPSYLHGSYLKVQLEFRFKQ